MSAQRMFKTPAILFALLLVACTDEPSAPSLPDFGGGSNDAFGARDADPIKLAALEAKAKPFVRPGTVMQVEPRLGVPTFLWTRPSLETKSAVAWLAEGAARPAVAAARATVAEHASLYNLADADVANAVVAHVDDRGIGPVLVKLRSQVGGIEVFREELGVLMTRDLEPVALSGYLTSPSTPAARTGGLAFARTASDGAAAAIAHLAQSGVDPAQLSRVGTQDGYESYALAPSAGIALDELVRVKRVYYHLPDGLEAAYYIEVMARTGAPRPDVVHIDGSELRTHEAYAYVVSAATGQLLSRTSLIADGTRAGGGEANALPPGGFTYRVWADPVDGLPSDAPTGNSAHPKVSPVPDGSQAPFVAMSDVTLPYFPFSMGDPWLPPGSTETVGNNVDAFSNLFNPDGYTPVAPPADLPTGDFRAQITAAGQFLHTHTPDGQGWTADGRQGSIQQLFYMNNFLHDWYYDAGFDEAAGNAQTNNFGRGGLGNDSLLAQAQDVSGFSNANMLTPADGGRPRMRMYVFPNLANHLDVTAPASIAGRRPLGIFMAGPGGFDITTNIVRANFSASPACVVTNAPALAGRHAMTDIDNNDGTGCAFLTRITNISQNTTASSVLIVYLAANPTAAANFTGFNTSLVKPLGSISWNNGQLIKAELTAGNTVVARMRRVPDRDGTIDNQIVAHEWGHYLSNRLVGNAAGLGAQQSAGMGEGWGDFSAMMITVRSSDTAVPSNATFNGVYALATHATSGVPFNGAANQSYYFGIRRYPYSTDLTKNPLTFRHIQEGVALPVGPPVAFGANGVGNSEVHNTGEVWTSMLWDCYAGILRDTLGPTPRLTFQQAQDRMRRYLVGGLKLTPAFPTFTEARDGVLATAFATDPADYLACRLGFTKRGAGANAVAPDRFSANNTPVVEDFATGPGLSFVSAKLDDSFGSCDSDGIVDHGEYGKLTLTLKNVGTTTLGAISTTVTGGAPAWFPFGNTVAFPSIIAGGTASVTMRVALPPTVSGIQQLDFVITSTDPTLGGPVTQTASFRVNTDDVPTSSTTDTVEATISPWIKLFNPLFGNVAPWTRTPVTASQHVWHVNDHGAGSDQYLLTPVMTVAAGGSVNLQFDHAWSFEFDAGGNYDGAVIERSVNGGAFTDIGASIYNGTLLVYAGNVNPLQGRAALVRSSAGTVHASLTQAVAAGSTVQFRFRAASDAAVGAAGWNVDNIAVTGIVGTPFPTIIADPDTCNVVPTSSDLAITKTDGVTSVNTGASVTYTIVASNLSGGNVIGATVVDTFPSELQNCLWGCVGAAGGVCGIAAGLGNILDRPELPVGGRTTYTATCTVAATTPSFLLTNTATVAPPGPVTDPVPGNNSATDVDAIIHLPAHLFGRKTVAGTFTTGGTVTYTVILGNDGTGTQQNNPGNEFLDVLPVGLSLVSASATSGTAVATPATRTVTWNGTIAAGGSVTITIIATIAAAAGTTISNQGTFNYDGDGNGSNESSGVTDAFPCP